MANPLTSLSERDRKVLLLALPLVALLAVALVIKALVGEHRQSAEKLDLVLEDIAWLQAQRDSLAQLNQACGRASWSDSTVRRLATRYGLNLQQSSRGESLALTIEAGHGNQVIAFLNDLECQGARVQSVSLKTVDDGGAVKGSAVIQLPVT